MRILLVGDEPNALRMQGLHCSLLVFCLVFIPRPVQADWLVAAFAGGAHSETGRLILVQPAPDTELEFSPVAYRSESWRPPIYYGARVTYLPTWRSHVGVELEFIHAKVIAETDARAAVRGRLQGTAMAPEELPIDRFVQRFALTHGLNFGFANLVARAPVATGTSGDDVLVLVGRVGAGFTLPHVESRIANVTQEQYERGGLAVQAAGGAEFRVTRWLRIITEYKFTRTAQRVTVPDGSINAVIKSHHGIVGLAFRI